MKLKFLVCLIILATCSVSESKKCEKSGVETLKDGNQLINIRFPKVHTDTHDQYMCTPFAVPNPNIDTYITEFIPAVKSTKAHHMMLYGCSGKPQNNNKIWSCLMGSVCPPGSEQVLYAWARDASQLKLPKQVGVRLGESAHITTLVLQIHYKHAMKHDQFDCSGMSLVVTPKPQKYYAGIFLLGATDIVVRAHSSGTAKVSCVDHVTSKLNVFAFRTHAHGLGKVITAYRVRNGRYRMIGKGNPRWPEAFYTRVGGSLGLMGGDKLMAVCDYVSNRDVTTYVGSTGADEMCNFYMMFYTSDKNVTYRSCWGDQLGIKFPESHKQMCPYPGYAGLVSRMAISSGRVKKPKIPTPMKMDNWKPAEQQTEDVNNDDDVFGDSAFEVEGDSPMKFEARDSDVSNYENMIEENDELTEGRF